MNLHKKLYSTYKAGTVETTKAVSINYFGYYGSAMNGVGSGNYIQHVKPFSNTVWIRGDNHAEIIEKLKLAQSQMHINLTTAIATINKIAPEKPTAMFYSYKEVKENMLIPVNLNWLGFDCYVADPGCPDKVVVDYFKIISRLRKPTQKIIIALDGYWGGPKAPTFADEQKVIERIRL